MSDGLGPLFQVPARPTIVCWDPTVEPAKRLTVKWCWCCGTARADRRFVDRVVYSRALPSACYRLVGWQRSLRTSKAVGRSHIAYVARLVPINSGQAERLRLTIALLSHWLRCSHWDEFQFVELKGNKNEINACKGP